MNSQGIVQDNVRVAVAQQNSGVAAINDACCRMTSGEPFTPEYGLGSVSKKGWQFFWTLVQVSSRGKGCFNSFTAAAELMKASAPWSSICVFGKDTVRVGVHAYACPCVVCVYDSCFEPASQEAVV